MKLLFVGIEPHLVEKVRDVARMHWPDAAVLVVRQADDGLRIAEQEAPDVVMYQLTFDRKCSEFLRRLEDLSSASIITVAPTPPGGSPSSMQWVAGFPNR